jgi:WD40 repeat protein
MLAFMNEGVESVAFDPKGGRMAIGSRLIQSIGGVVRLIDLDGTGEPVVLLRCPQPIVYLTFSIDGQWLVAASSDKTLDAGGALVWRVLARGLFFPEPSVLSHLDGVLHAAFSASGEALATASEDQTSIVWRHINREWQPSLRPLRCNGQVYACAFSPNDRWLATASRTPEAQQAGTWSSQVRVWDVANNEPVSLPLPFSELVTRLAFVAGETMLLVESWRPPAEPKRWLVNLPVNEGSAKDLLLRAQLVSGQRSFLVGRTQHPTNAWEGKLSAEQAMTYAMSVGPLRPLTKEELKGLWFHFADRRSTLP